MAYTVCVNHRNNKILSISDFLVVTDLKFKYGK